jgi:hypothetical protein
MELIDTFYQEHMIDCFTFVFDEVDPLTGYNTMLATSETGADFSQWTEGLYVPEGNNSHLGNQVCAIGKVLVEHVAGRLEEQ